MGRGIGLDRILPGYENGVFYGIVEQELSSSDINNWG